MAPGGPAAGAHVTGDVFLPSVSPVTLTNNPTQDRTVAQDSDFTEERPRSPASGRVKCHGLQQTGHHDVREREASSVTGLGSCHGGFERG